MSHTYVCIGHSSSVADLWRNVNSLNRELPRKFALRRRCRYRGGRRGFNWTAPEGGGRGGNDSLDTSLSPRTLFLHCLSSSRICAFHVGYEPKVTVKRQSFHGLYFYRPCKESCHGLQGPVSWLTGDVADLDAPRIGSPVQMCSRIWTPGVQISKRLWTPCKNLLSQVNSKENLAICMLTTQMTFLLFSLVYCKTDGLVLKTCRCKRKLLPGVKIR